MGIHFFTKKAESTGAILFRRSPQSGQFTIIRISAALPSPVGGRKLESEHFLQHRLAVHIGQDSSLLDGVVMLVEGEGAGDAVDGAGGNGIDDSLLVIVGASLETGILSSLQAVDDGLCCIVAQRREAVGVLLTVLCLVGILKLGVGALCVVGAEVSVLQLIV